MTRYICIHGHFYQPPRENPWLEEIELQDSASPYHDWNQRVTFECYAPNAASRILDSDRKIIDIVNNYKKISFNFGPTLLYWMEARRPETLRAIIEAGTQDKKLFSGHSSAIAQAFNHMIMPLSNYRDRRTQIIWGIKEYEQRFHGKPEGIWLPETAVDKKSLDIIAEMGLKFVILAPHQIARYRKIGDSEWSEAIKELDLRMPYLCKLESGRTISLFIYDGQISKDVGFNNLLDNGEAFADRFIKAFSGEADQLVHIATDGETYGHHHPKGDMALAYSIYHIESKNLAKITVYGEYLEKHPPSHEAEILENTSWSCPHGVERWKADCGCNTGSHFGWNQAWRAPLRWAMDWLREALILMYESEAGKYLKDPWGARDYYIDVILNRSAENVNKFLYVHAGRELSRDEKVKVLKLLEMQRHAMLMYSSDGWFFDEISGTETVQVIKYAARAMQLAKELNGSDLEPEYIKILNQAKSNLPEFGDGARIYEAFVRPATLDLLRVAVHYAISSLFSEYPEKAKIFSYIVEKGSYDIKKAGEEKLAIGKVHVSSEITWEESDFSFAVIHFGNRNLLGGAHKFKDDESYRLMQDEIENAFAKSDIPETIRLMDKHFGAHNYTIRHLFKDEQRRILDSILEPEQNDINAFFRQLYEHNYPLLQTMKDLGIQIPKDFSFIIKSAIEAEFSALLKEEKIHLEKLMKLTDDAKKMSPELDKSYLNFIVSRRVDEMMEKIDKDPKDLDQMKIISDLLWMAGILKLELNLWKAQNILFSMTRRLGEEIKEKADKGDKNAMRWIELVTSIEDRMQVRTM